MKRFAACFAELEDSREDNARHALNEILMIALCAMLCGAEDCSDMALFGRAKEPFLRQFLQLRHGIPSHDTFSRVFRLLDPAQFQLCFRRFMEDFVTAAQEVIAIDGKTLRRSFDRASGKSPLHLVSAWASGARLVLGQVATDEKSNEITAVPKLLQMLSLEGAIVAADALNCQRAIAVLQLLGVERHPKPVVPKNFQKIAPLATKHVQIASEWIALQRLLHLECESIHPTTHVCSTCGQPDPHTGWGTHHPRSALTTRRNTVRLTSLLTSSRHPSGKTISIPTATPRRFFGTDAAPTADGESGASVTRTGTNLSPSTFPSRPSRT
jgi:predicted transposase YbfD/YdcC